MAAALAGLLATGAAAAAPRALEPDTPIERPIAGGEEHRYDVVVGLGRTYWAAVEQLGIDLTVSLLDADGRELVAVDNPLGRHGRESLVLETSAAGRPTLVVTAAARRVAAGRYRLELRELARQSATDEHLLSALEAMTAGGQAHRAPDGGPAAALGAYRRALGDWRQLADATGEAHALHAIALLERRLGESRLALASYRAALERWRLLGDRYLEAAALNDLGLTHFDLGENELAMPLLEEAIALQQRLGNRFGEAVARNNICLRRLSEGELESAVSCFERVLDLHREGGEGLAEARTLINLGGAYYTLGEPEPAFARFEDSLSLMRSLGDRLGEAQALNNLAACHQGLGELQQALLYYREARDVFRELGNHRWLGRTLNNLGVTYLRLGNPERAERFLEQALSLRRQVADRRGEAVTLNNLGKAHAGRRQHRAALELHLQALELSQKAQDRRRQATTLTLVGRSRLALGELDRALGDLEQAATTLEALGDRRGEAEARLESARVLLALDRPEPAAASLGEALALYSGMRHPLGEAAALVELGRVERRLGRLESALERARAARERIETLRASLGSLSLRAQFLGSRREAYELEVDLLMERGVREPGRGFDRLALEAGERARARSLLDVLEQVEPRPPRHRDPKLAAERAALKRRLNAKARRQLELLSRERPGEAAGAAAVAATLEAEIDGLIAELEALEARMRSSAAEPAEPISAGPLTVEEIRRLLDPDTTLLVYLLAAERSFLWRVDAESFESFELPGRKRVESLARDLHRQLSTLDADGADRRRGLLAAASDLLLGPLAGRMAGSRLVVVADGALHYLPFSVLPLAPGGDPLVRSHEVVNLPSVTVLARQRRVLASRPPAAKRLAVVADPVFSPADSRLRQGGTANVARRFEDEPSTAVILDDPERERGQGVPRPQALGFDRLPATRSEAERIASLVPGGAHDGVLLALDFEASRPTLLERLGDYRFVHLATHGLLDTRHPELSGLVLSLVDEEGRSRDGTVRVHDLYDLELHAELVVLSGCETALGSEMLGEGLVGLTRGFMDAGAARVVSSLWRVADRSTAELMAAFYRALWVEGLRPAAALRSAQLEILASRRSWRHPYHWAGFVLYGDWR